MWKLSAVTVIAFSKEYPGLEKNVFLEKRANYYVHSLASKKIKNNSNNSLVSRILPTRYR